MCSVGSGMPATVTEMVAGIAALAAELAARPAPDSGAACYEQAEALGRVVDLLESAIAARVGVAARSGQVAEWGHASPAAWLRTSLAMRHGRAEERAVVAEQLPRLPHVAERLATGALSSGYAAAIAGGVRRLDDADTGKAEQVLLGFVDEGHSVGQVIRFADKIKDLIADRDGTAAEPEDGRRAERQWLAIHRCGSGAFVKGRFGAELTALIKARLQPLATPCGADDTRDHAERLADALHTYLSGGDSRWDPIVVINLHQPVPPVPATARTTGPEGAPESAEHGASMPHHAIAAGMQEPAKRPFTPASGGKPGRWATSRPAPALHRPTRRRPQTALVDGGDAADDGQQQPCPHPTSPPGAGPRTGHASADQPNPAGAGTESAGPIRPFARVHFTARLADGTPIPTERARQILLNAGFSALVLGSDGLPLYLGRRVRCASPAQRRVLLTRYATCVVDGCEIPATACQIDHIDGWEVGQPTDIDRLVPCCSFHNRYKWRHPERVTIHQDADGRYRYRITRPSGRYAGGRRGRIDQPAPGPDP